LNLKLHNKTLISIKNKLLIPLNNKFLPFPSYVDIGEQIRGL